MHTDRALRFVPTVEIVIVSIVFLTTLVHGLSYLLSEYTASADDSKAWGIILGYQCSLTFVLVAWVFFRNNRTGAGIEMPARSITGAVEACTRFLPSMLVLCCIGLGFHAYSKLALVNFHIPSCVGELRHVWITTSHDQIPVFRRITSVIGHVLSSFAYAGLFFALYRYSIGVRRRSSVVFAALFFLGGAVYAALIGSQNAALGLLVVAILAIGLGAISVPTFWRGWGNRTAVVLAFTMVAALFSFSVFNNRVQCGGGLATTETFQQYESGFLDEIPMRRKAALSGLALYVRQVCNPCNSIFIYLNHGIFNFEYILAQDEVRGDPVFFAFFKGMAQRFGYTFDEPTMKRRVYGHGGATLPGTAYHDFGMAGVMLVGVVHALLTILAGTLLRSGSLYWEGAGLVLFVAVGFMTALSMMFVGFNVISFPFIVISMTLAMIGMVGWVKWNSLWVERRFRATSVVEPRSSAAPVVFRERRLVAREITAK